MTGTDSHAEAGSPLEPAAVDDLSLRFRSLRDGEKAARAEARRLERELALTRRLLKFQLDGTSMARPAAATPEGSTTILLSQPLVCHLDAVENLGVSTAISGWAFRPMPGWDARAATVALLLRHDDTLFQTVCRPVARPDVAAFYAGQPPGTSGGAVGLEGAGFACEIRHDALPAGTEWKIVLRLECRGQVCEQFTGQFLRR